MIGWEAKWEHTNVPQRNSTGFLMPNATRFPRGMKWLVAQVKDLGFQDFGMYAPMSPPDPDGKNRTLGFESKDAAYFASVGSRWVKVDGLKIARTPGFAEAEIMQWREGINATGM